MAEGPCNGNSHHQGATDADGTPGEQIDALLPAAYEEVRALAEVALRRGYVAEPTRATSLVNDIYLRLAQRGITFRDQGHFLALAAKAMRCVLVDRARSSGRLKRGGDLSRQHMELDMLPALNDPELLALHDALEHLAKFDPPKARLVELRYFGGLSMEEAAPVLGVSLATAKREWASAKAWLYRALNEGSGTSCESASANDS